MRICERAPGVRRLDHNRPVIGDRAVSRTSPYVNTVVSVYQAVADIDRFSRDCISASDGACEIVVDIARCTNGDVQNTSAVVVYLPIHGVEGMCVSCIGRWSAEFPNYRKVIDEGADFG